MHCTVWVIYQLTHVSLSHPAEPVQFPSVLCLMTLHHNGDNLSSLRPDNIVYFPLALLIASFQPLFSELMSQLCANIQLLYYLDVEVQVLVYQGVFIDNTFEAGFFQMDNAFSIVFLELSLSYLGMNV